MLLQGHKWIAGPVLLCGLYLAGCNQVSVDRPDLMQQAKQYMQAGNQAAAAVELRNVLVANADDAEARYLLAGIYLRYGDFEAAEKEYRSAAAAGWDATQSAAGRNRALLGMGEYAAVLAATGPDGSPPAGTSATLLSQRALALAAQGETGQARAALAAARALDGKSVDVIEADIRLRILADETDAAMQLLDDAIATCPDTADLLMLRAALHAGVDSGAAMADFRRVAALDSAGFISANGRMARLQMAQLLILDGADGEAEQLVESLRVHDTDDAFVNYLAGVLAFRRGDYTSAKELLLKVLEVAPGHNPTRLLFGVLSYALENYEQSAYFLSKYIAAVPDNLVARKLLARSYILLGQNDSAATLLKESSATVQDDAELLALAGVSELGMGRTAAAIAGFEQAVKIDPDSVELRKQLARAYIEAGETALALQQLDSALAAGGVREEVESLEIIALLRGGQHDKAVSQALRLAERRPDDAAVQALAGTVLAAAGDLAAARTRFIHARELQPGFRPATLSLAQVEQQLGNLAAARKLYMELVNDDVDSIQPMLSLANLFRAEGDDAGRLLWLEKAAQLAPDNAQLKLMLAGYYLDNDDAGRARAIVRDSTAAEQDSPPLLAMQARIAMAGHDYPQALQFLQQLMDADPGSLAGSLLLGEVNLRLGRIAGARTALTSARALAPDDPAVISLLVRLEIQAGNAQQALAYSKLLQQARPGSYLGYELAGDSLMAAGDFAQADAAYRRAIGLQPAGRLQVKLADNAARSGQLQTGMELLQQWLESHPDDVGVWQSLGTALLTAGRDAEADRAYRRVIQADPDNVVALNNLALINAGLHYDDALQFAERAWQGAQDDPAVLDTYGWILVQGGQYGKGLRILQQARASLPDNPDIRFHYSVALFNAGDRTAARRELSALLEAAGPFDGRGAAERLQESWAAGQDVN